MHGDRPQSVPIDPAADLALLPYSSGTTGLAKGVMLTHRACVTNVVQMLTAMPVDPTDRVLAVAPFFHVVGFAVLANRTLHCGATLVTLPRFDVTGYSPRCRITGSARPSSFRRSCWRWPSIPRSTSTTCRRCSGSAAGPHRSAPNCSRPARTGWGAQSGQG